MNQINWTEEVLKRKEALIKDTQTFLQIKSVLDEENGTANAPLGKGIQEALQFMLSKGKEEGFITKDVEHLAGHIEMGQGENILGILCHVDVVPEGDGWTTDPYSADIRDGKIYARGALDDKGPTMAAFYAMKIVHELKLPLSKRVRMILGTDEESDWRCVDTYFKHEEMPQLGFAPDADFPIIFAEKGIWDFYMKQSTTNGEQSGAVTVKQFESGRRFNMVPDLATVVLEVTAESNKLEEAFKTFIEEHNLKGTYQANGTSVSISIEGVSAHGMEPKNGVNAGLYLAAFLKNMDLSQQATAFFTFVTDYLWNDSRGESFNIAFKDEATGDVTLNIGLVNYNEQDGGTIGVNLRYPVSYNYEDATKQLETVLQQQGFTISTVSHSGPHHVDANSFLVQTLSEVYEGQTGEKAELLAIGGGTYARSLEAGVAFGPLFPGREDIAHQKDEYMFIEDLLKATALYAEAIYRLAK
ncbi:dipeptidase PepV [Bacillus sp. JJ722]|uniref:dipeptidase PepV n=1 Tax=Bacillus sp. JJ722 TaxID=3122973 RepID=UPI002FFD8D6D